jgi:putative acid phosphatase of HAD superfamily subfamily IIIB
MLDAMRRAYCQKNHSFTTLTLIAALVPALLLPIVTRADECPTTPNLPSSDGSQPANLGILKLQLVDYKCFGAYDRDVANVLADATAYLEHRANEFGKLALVLDTTRHRFPICRICWPNFGFFRGGTCTLVPGEPCGFDRWITDHTADPILPTLRLFNTAKAKGVAIFFISTRREDQRDATVNNLS